MFPFIQKKKFLIFFLFKKKIKYKGERIKLKCSDLCVRKRKQSIKKMPAKARRCRRRRRTKLVISPKHQEEQAHSPTLPIEHFKEEGKKFLLDLKRFHHHQAKKHDDKQLSKSEWETINQFDREVRAKWIHDRIEDRFIGLCPKAKHFFLESVLERRLDGMTLGWCHSQPYGEARFCPQQDWCNFQSWFGFCDLWHVADLNEGDIVYGDVVMTSESCGKNKDNMGRVTTTSSYAIWNAAKDSCVQHVLLIQGTLDNDSSALHPPLQSLLPPSSLCHNLDVPHNQARSDGFLFVIGANAKYCSTFQPIQAACRRVYGCSVKQIHLQVMAELFDPICYLDLFLAGRLDKELVHFLCKRARWVPDGIQKQIPQPRFHEWIKNDVRALVRSFFSPVA